MAKTSTTKIPDIDYMHHDSITGTTYNVTQWGTASEEIQTNASTQLKDARSDDFGQFRIKNNWKEVQDIVDSLVDNGYSVTVKKSNTESIEYLVMYRFGEL